MRPYRFDIRTIVLALYPIIVATTEDGTSASGIRVHPLTEIVETALNASANLSGFPSFLPSANWLCEVGAVHTSMYLTLFLILVLS